MVFRDPIIFWPGVYGTQGDDKTWNSLSCTSSAGAATRRSPPF
jgi:hypothetical protein